MKMKMKMPMGNIKKILALPTHLMLILSQQ